jgi:hypothetical protein
MPTNIFRGTRRLRSLLPASAIVMLSALIVTTIFAAGVWKLERKTELPRRHRRPLYHRLLFVASEDVSREECERFGQSNTHEAQKAS